MTFRKTFLYLFCYFFLFSCADKELIDNARKKSDTFMENLGSENAYLTFPEAYFSRTEMKAYFSGFGINCDYDNKRGKFVDYYMESTNEARNISFIYEYLLKCDSLRFVLKFNLEGEPGLVGFRVEPIEQYNPLIIDKSKSLFPFDDR